MNQQTQVNTECKARIGVFDRSGKFMGYKSDTGWTLDEEVFKTENLTNGEIRPVIKKNLLFCLNEYIDTEKRKDHYYNGARVVALPLDRDVPQDTDVSFTVFLNDENKFEIRDGLRQ